MMEFFSTAYGQITTVAAVVAVLWGLLKAIGALRKWNHEKIKLLKEKKKEHDELPERLYKMVQQIDQKLQQTNASLDNVESKLNLVTERLAENDEATATLMLEKMMWAYHHYVLECYEIPLDTQTALCVMFDQYKRNKKHNHVPDDFKERIMACKVVGSR